MKNNIKKNIKKYVGMSLVEMIMAIAIFTVGIGGFSMLFAKTWKTNFYVLETGQASMAVSQGINRVVGYIRGARQGDDGAYAIVSANDNDLVIFSYYNKDEITERLHFYRSGSSILMGITLPTETLPKTYPASDQQTTVIANNIINPTDVPVFYYYNADYPADLVNNPVSTPAVPLDIRLVKIYLETDIYPQYAPNNLKMQSFVEIRNLNDYDRID